MSDEVLVERIVDALVVSPLAVTGGTDLAPFTRTAERLADEAGGWHGYDSRDTGHVFAADTVTDFIDDLRAALTDTGAAEAFNDALAEAWEEGNDAGYDDYPGDLPNPYRAAEVLRKTARDARERGDVGKPHGPEVWDYLDARADHIESPTHEGNQA